MEIERKVETFEVNYICDKCETGKMKQSGECLTTFPAQYVHVCDECGCKQTFNHVYPYIKYKYINTD